MNQKPDDSEVLAAVCAWLDTNIDEQIPPLTRLQTLNEVGELEPAETSIPRLILILPTNLTLASTDQVLADLNDVEEPGLRTMIESMGARNEQKGPLRIASLPSGFCIAPKDWFPENMFFQRDNPGVQGWLSFYRPGYNRDADAAIVRTWFGPTAHGATWDFVLHRSGDGWRVTWQSVNYYL